MKKTMMLALGLVLAAAVVAAQGKMSWNFDADKVGEIAKGFTNEMGKWEVVADDTAPSKPNVLAQLAKSSGSTFNITLVNDTNYKDVDITVKMKAIAGKHRSRRWHCLESQRREELLRGPFQST